MLANPRSDRVKAIRALSGRSARRRHGRFVAEGPQAAREAAGSPSLIALYVTQQGLDRHADVVQEGRRRGVLVTLVTDEVMAAMADTVTPQGILAVCAALDVPLADVVASRPRLVAVLAHVRDPGNAGTVIRAADAAGADAVVVTESSVDVMSPKCVRSTAGSLFHRPIAVGARLEDAVAALRAAGLQVFAADAGATSVAVDSLGPSLAMPTAWVFGNEAWGLSPQERALADAVVRVPIYGRAESLNLAMAASVCLYASAFAQAHLRDFETDSMPTPPPRDELDEHT